jgi:hypothetical protein
MLVKLLGIIDIVLALLFFINNNFDKSNWFPNKIILIVGIMLLVKGIIFVLMLDFASLIDIACGIIIILSAFMHIHVLLAFIVCIFLIQKGILSLVS